ncbi:SGNH/GDSL hydrolase family protein [Agromyces sp. NPDC056523]|uniref:SGNH/GDSL hydrolase family protein n=1 Tax=Agromyces sp. NPDC056523 TaxID=3345850 RepID=UPI00366F5581
MSVLSTRPDAAVTADRRPLVALAAALLAGVVVAIAGAAAGPTAPASAAVTELDYAAVGDSYAAGTGARPYLDSTCYRSSKSYPKLLDLDANRRLVSFPACSGASTVETVSQVATIPTTTKVVTVTVGGNDVGFSKVMQNCFVLPRSTCKATIDAGTAVANSQAFKDKLASVLTAVRNRTEPDATVIVAGYPQLFHLTNGVNRKYAWADEVNAQTVVLNNVIKTVVVANGAKFVDVQTAFAGHGIGSVAPWINDWNWLRTVDGFHPNATGYVAYANAIRAVPVA